MSKHKPNERTSQKVVKFNLLVIPHERLHADVLILQASKTLRAVQKVVVQAEVEGGGEAEGGLDALELGVEGVLWRDE